MDYAAEAKCLVFQLSVTLIQFEEACNRSLNNVWPRLSEEFEAVKNTDFTFVRKREERYQKCN